MLEGELQSTLPYEVDFLDVNLIFAALFVNTDAAAHGDLQAVFGTELDAALLLLEINAFHLSAIVFEREVDVAGLGCAAVGDFALHTDVGKVFGEEVADLSGQLADGKGVARGHQVESELLGHEERPRKDEVMK